VSDVWQDLFAFIVGVKQSKKSSLLGLLYSDDEDVTSYATSVFTTVGL
jgi:hypothetical protein